MWEPAGSYIPQGTYPQSPSKPETRLHIYGRHRNRLDVVTDSVKDVIVRGKLLIPPFELWVATVAVYAGLAHFFPALASSGTARVVERELPNLVTLWCVLYGLGGLVMIFGLFRRSPRLEGAGLCLLGSGVTVAMIASLATGAAIVPVLIGQGGVALACVARLFVLRALP